MVVFGFAGDVLDKTVLALEELAGQEDALDQPDKVMV